MFPVKQPSEAAATGPTLALMPKARPKLYFDQRAVYLRLNNLPPDTAHDLAAAVNGTTMDVLNMEDLRLVLHFVKKWERDALSFELLLTRYKLSHLLPSRPRKHDKDRIPTVYVGEQERSTRPILYRPQRARPVFSPTGDGSILGYYIPPRREALWEHSLPMATGPPLGSTHMSVYDDPQTMHGRNIVHDEALDDFAPTDAKLDAWKQLLLTNSRNAMLDRCIPRLCKAIGDAAQARDDEDDDDEDDEEGEESASSDDDQAVA